MPSRLSVPAFIPRLICPRRTYDRSRAAIGIIEVDGAVPFTVVAKMITEKHNVAFLRPFMLGSATSTLVIAGDIADVRGATDPKWLMEEGVLGKFHKRNPLLGSHCFDGPSEALWQVMRDIEPMPAPPIDLTGKKLTLGVWEALRMGPFLKALEYMGRRGEVTYIGSMNVGSRHKSVFFAGTQAQVEAAKFGAKDYVRALMAEKATTGEYDGSWFLPLDATHHDLTFLLPWGSNPRPFHDLAGADSYLAIEAHGLVAFFTAVNAAAWRARVTVLAPRELGSGTETAILTSPDVDAINFAGDRARIEEACGKYRGGKESVINVHIFHHPLEIFGAHMSEIRPSEPRFDMAGLSVGLVDTVHRGLLYDALHILRKFDVRLIGTRKIGSKQVFMAFAGPQAQVDAALKEIASDLDQKLAAKERTGELFSLGIIENPNDEVLCLLPWQAASSYLTEVPTGSLLPATYYQPGQPMAIIETLGLAHQLAIANAIFHEVGISPVSRYGAGSGLESFHYAAENFETLRRVVDKAFLERACTGMPGTDKMLLNAAAYAQPGPAMWEAIDHLQPVTAAAVERLSAPGNALGFITAKGMDTTLRILDRLKDFGVNLWGIQKSGGLLMTVVIDGPLAQVNSAVEAITNEMTELHGAKQLSGETCSWGVIGNPHPNLAFLLPRNIRVGV